MRFLNIVLTVVALAGCTTPPQPDHRSSQPFPDRASTTSSQEASGEKKTSRPFFEEKLREMDAAVLSNISSNRLPGGVLWVERHGQSYQKAYGNRAVRPTLEPMTEHTIFDAASLTKVVATTPAILLLVERGQIDLDAPAAKYLPEFGTKGKEKITVRHLLTHTSGLRPGIPANPPWSGYEKAIELAFSEAPVAQPGTIFRYSDINFIVLGELVRRVSGQPLNTFAKEFLFEPLEMKDTLFLPTQELISRVAPTEKVGEQFLRGTVHDPTARRMGGVAGHAGLFTTAADLARYARCLLNDGWHNGKQIFRPETIRSMRSVQTPEQLRTRRGLGWDIDSPYAGPRGKFLPIGSFGHTGWTGTSIWIDPFSQTFVIFLSNRNHPDESGSVLALRNQLGTLAAEAVKDFNFLYVPGALEAQAEEERQAVRTVQVLNGIDVLKRQKFAPLQGLRLGLITNHTGTDRERNAIIDLLHQAEGIQLVALFSPEHGIRGELDEKVNDGVDEKTGLPIFSLYGERRTPTPEQLQNLDALVFDIQDIGCRFYTYISTMGNCMQAAASTGKKFFVLDRVNPINGEKIEGPVLQGEQSFTGWHEIPVRHAMTVGELARMFNEERQIKADLQVIRVEGWQRDMFFDQTSLPWINPSPNMRSLTQAILYPGVGLLETTSLSVGRGTDTPFEVIGAPYIDEMKLALELNRAGLTGIRFVPIRFTPRASVFKGQLCKGVNIILTDRERCNVLEVGMLLALKLQQFYPDDFGLEKYNRLLVHPPTLEAIRSQKTVEQIRNSWQADLNAFRSRRAKFLLY